MAGVTVLRMIRAAVPIVFFAVDLSRMRPTCSTGMCYARRTVEGIRHVALKRL